jgi:hypothetical protein
VSVIPRMENAEWPVFRVLYADTFTYNGGTTWTVADMLAPGVNGLWVKSITRQVLPAIGEAEIVMEFGQIDGETVTPLDLLGKHVRIQAARPPVGDETPTWRTVWLGRVAWQDDSISPGASIQRGTRLYRCQDLLYSYLSQYPMDRHANYANTGALSFGHPGYNWRRDQPGTTVGNRESTGSGFSGPDSTTILNFGIDDDAAIKTTTTWTDGQALNNAMMIRRNTGDPLFVPDVQPSGLLSGVTPWEVRDGDVAWDVVTRILNRRRGKGLAYLDWDDDSAGPTGAIIPYVRVRPQLASDLTYTDPTGSSVTISGASSVTDSTVIVDIQGDHRVVDSAFQIRDYGESTVDELTTEGEPILVAVTLSGFDGTLAERWTSAQETAWAADPENPIYNPVLQRFGLLRTAVFTYEDGNNGVTVTGQRGDYWTNAVGQTSISHTGVTAPEMVEIEDCLPLWEGYDYTSGNGTPSASATADGLPRMRPPLVLIRTTDNRYITPEQLEDGGYQIKIDRDAIQFEFNADRDGDRRIRTTYASRTITEASLTFTLGLRMPQRPRIVSAISGTVRRRRTIRMDGCDLWVAHPGCIWALDLTSENADGYTAKRTTGTITTGVEGRVLKDDRATMARAHYLAWEWYRSDTSRCAVSYAIRDCGLLPTWTDISGTDRAYAKLGQMLTSLTAAGQTYTPNTPITRVEYDNGTGTTTWHTDWQELDYGTA